MRQQLESMMDSYQPMVSEQRQQTYFVVGDLESLSASALYTPKLTIRPLGPNSSLNIHEGSGGTAHIKTRLKVDGSQYQNLNSYEAAMMDLLLDKAKMPKIQK